MNIRLTEEQKQVILNLVKKTIELKSKGVKPIVIAFKAPGGFGKTICALTYAVLLRRYFSSLGREAKFIFITRTRTQLRIYVYNFYKMFHDVLSVRLNKNEICRKLINFEYLEECIKCPYFRNYAPYKLLESVREYLLNKVFPKGIFDPYAIIDDIVKLFNICPYHTFGKFSENFIVCTFPYLIHKNFRDLLFISYNLGREDIVKTCVIDEAHNLDELYLETGFEISSNVLNKIIQDEKNSKLSKDIKQLFQLDKNVEEGVIIKVDENKLVEVYAQVEQKIQPFLEDQNIEKLRERSHYIVLYVFSKALLEYELGKKLGDEVVLVKTSDGFAIRKITYMYMFEDIFQTWDIVLLMSATLQPRWYMEKVWKIPSENLVYIEVTTEFAKPKIFIDPSVTTKFEDRSEEMWIEYAKKIEKIYKIATNSVLVVFPSYEILHNILKHLNIGKEYLIIEDRNTIFENVINQLVNNKKVILAVAGGRFVEGVEYVKEGKQLISDVVIVGVPYPKKTQYMTILLKNITKVSDVNPFDVLKVWALMKVEQALRRSTRYITKDFESRWWLLDKRYVDLIHELIPVEKLRKREKKVSF